MIFKNYGYIVNCSCEMAKELQEMPQDTVINWFNFNIGDAFYSGVGTYKCINVDHKNKVIKFVNEERLHFTKPKRPFMLVYESEKDGMSIAWLETLEDMIETIEEVKSYGSTIVDAIEIGSCRDVIVDGIVDES